MRKKTRRDTRVNVVLKLSLTQDADLIDWLESLPRGTRHAAVKAALREAIGKPTRDPLSRLADKTERIWQDLGALKTWLDERLQQVTVTANGNEASAPSVESAPRLDEAALAARAERMKKARW